MNRRTLAVWLGIMSQILSLAPGALPSPPLSSWLAAVPSPPGHPAHDVTSLDLARLLDAQASVSGPGPPARVLPVFSAL